MEYKRFSVGFVLAALLVTNARVSLADDLPPPPPPPPGTNPTPSVPTNSGVLDAPPPPPPGVNVEPPRITAPTPSTSTPVPPPTASTLQPNPSVLAPPPKPPPGVDPVVPEPQPAKAPRRQPRQTAGPRSEPNTHPNYRPEDLPRQNAPGGWYGWKSLIGLVPVYGLFIGAAVSEEETLLFPAVVGGMLVTPIAHWTHGNKGRGWLSFGLNIGTMLVGGAIGGGSGAPFALGIWNVIDVVGLHHKTEPVKPPSAMASVLQSMAIVPMMDQGRKGFTIMGQF